jgi:hypothetical protein
MHQVYFNGDCSVSGFHIIALLRLTSRLRRLERYACSPARAVHCHAQKGTALYVAPQRLTAAIAARRARRYAKPRNGCVGEYRNASRFATVSALMSCRVLNSAGFWRQEPVGLAQAQDQYHRRDRYQHEALYFSSKEDQWLCRWCRCARAQSYTLQIHLCTASRQRPRNTVGEASPYNSREMKSNFGHSEEAWVRRGWHARVVQVAAGKTPGGPCSGSLGTRTQTGSCWNSVIQDAWKADASGFGLLQGQVQRKEMTTQQCYVHRQSSSVRRLSCEQATRTVPYTCQC